MREVKTGVVRWYTHTHAVGARAHGNTHATNIYTRARAHTHIHKHTHTRAHTCMRVSRSVRGGLKRRRSNNDPRTTRSRELIETS